MTGVLMVNLGTPEAPTPKAVGRYLNEFLSDPLVVDLPAWLWRPLLRLVIVPLRRRRSAEAYRKVWTEEGSPLLVLSRRLAERVQQALGAQFQVELAMRYGAPSIRSGLEKLRQAGVERLVVLPLYPQYSRTTTQTVIDGVSEALRDMQWFPAISTVQRYHDHPDWIEAVADSVRRFRQEHGAADKLLFSLHGIPQRYARAGDPYPLECQQSVAAIVQVLGLEPRHWLLAFQSRVGREPWLQPYTDFVLKEWAESGVRTVQVACPGFAVDCLETLEEIAMQNEELFREHGGERLEYIPALNDSPAQVAMMATLVRDAPAPGPARQP
ncbi:MAG: ferrochelatase [Xanthomonadales bacterium]|nr:ferrochelatase [Xanthomonadales bacterium]